MSQASNIISTSNTCKIFYVKMEKSLKLLGEKQNPECKHWKPRARDTQMCWPTSNKTTEYSDDQKGLFLSALFLYQLSSNVKIYPRS